MNECLFDPLRLTVRCDRTRSTCRHPTTRILSTISVYAYQWSTQPPLLLRLSSSNGVAVKFAIVEENGDKREFTRRQRITGGASSSPSQTSATTENLHRKQCVSKTHWRLRYIQELVADISVITKAELICTTRLPLSIDLRDARIALCLKIPGLGFGYGHLYCRSLRSELQMATRKAAFLLKYDLDCCRLSAVVFADATRTSCWKSLSSNPYRFCNWHDSRLDKRDLENKFITYLVSASQSSTLYGYLNKLGSEMQSIREYTKLGWTRWFPLHIAQNKSYSLPFI